jgi:hypothetical protein
MDELFEIPVLYKGQELLFPARLLIVGYVHKFVVTIDKQEFFLNKMIMENIGQLLTLQTKEK